MHIYRICASLPGCKCVYTHNDTCKHQHLPTHLGVVSLFHTSRLKSVIIVPKVNTHTHTHTHTHLGVAGLLNHCEHIPNLKYKDAAVIETPVLQECIYR